MFKLRFEVFLTKVNKNYHVYRHIIITSKKDKKTRDVDEL